MSEDKYDPSGSKPNTWVLMFEGGKLTINIERDKETNEPIVDFNKIDFGKLLMPAAIQLEQRIEELKHEP